MLLRLGRTRRGLWLRPSGASDTTLRPRLLRLAVRCRAVAVAVAVAVVVVALVVLIESVARAWLELARVILGLSEALARSCCLAVSCLRRDGWCRVRPCPSFASGPLLCL